MRTFLATSILILFAATASAAEANSTLPIQPVAGSTVPVPSAETKSWDVMKLNFGV